MLRPRIIPCLLVHQNALWKSCRFSDHKYVGDPINAVRIFNEKEVDELVVLDIDASRNGKPPDMELIRSLAAECRMPLCYGGGISTAEQVASIISLGVEKVAISHAAIQDVNLIRRSAELVGCQSVVGVIDVKRNFFGGFSVSTLNGTKTAKSSARELAIKFQEAGAGELIVNSIDRDGTMSGYDLELLQQIRDVTDIPMTALGGAGNFAHLQELFRRFGIIGGAAGSLFVFKGKYRAVLINYPTPAEKLDIFGLSN
jgi:cyclase